MKIFFAFSETIIQLSALFFYRIEKSFFIVKLQQVYVEGRSQNVLREFA